MKYNIALLTCTMLLFASVAWGQGNPIKDSCITASNTLPANGDPNLHVYSSWDFTNFKFTLYNRWGKEVYTSSKFKDPLDLDILEQVKVNDKLQYKYPTGIYVWSAAYLKETPEGPSKRLSSGSITIISAP